MLSNENLYQRYRPKLLNICKEYAGEDDAAEDLLHDAFVIILTSLDKLEDPEKIESWMTAIVRNVGYHYRQHVNKEQSALHRLAQERPEIAETSLTPDYDELQSLVALLPQGYQQVFRLSVFEGLSHQEISQLLGIAPHSSSSQLSHAKRMLLALIKKSWVLVLLLIAIPTAIWKLLQKQDPETKPMATTQKPHEPRPEPVVETPHDEPVYASVKKSASSHPVSYQTEAVIQPDSVPYIDSEESGEERLETPKTTPKTFPDDSHDVLSHQEHGASVWPTTDR